LFGVLPAAIEKDILIACAPRHTLSEEHHTLKAPGSVVADNLHPKYSRQVFAPSAKKLETSEIGEDKAHVETWHLDINTQELRWESYVKAGYYGVLEYCFPSASRAEFSQSNELPVPLDILVTGSVPAGSGLSSSAAMVVASTLAFLAANGKLDRTNPSNTITKGDLVRMAMKNEQRVGVNSGGMDQAASVMSDPSSALYITFYPKLKASAVPLPPHCVFVCANSLVVSDKAITAKHRYNLRVVETLVGARILARHLNIPVGDRERITFREVVGKFIGEQADQELDISALMQSLSAMMVHADILRPAGYQGPDDEPGVTMEEMVEKSGLSKKQFYDLYLSHAEVEATYFQLFNRALHVFSEVLRVLQFREICLSFSNNSEYTGVIEELLGDQMNKSQTSCNVLFDCSCPELNQLVHLATEAGAFGSRLTGAGWGGCIVSLVKETEVASFIQKMKETYPPYKNLEGDALDEVIFATKPSSGACVFQLD